MFFSEYKQKEAKAQRMYDELLGDIQNLPEKAQKILLDIERDAKIQSRHGMVMDARTKMQRFSVLMREKKRTLFDGEEYARW